MKQKEIDRLREIQGEMLNLLSEARSILCEGAPRATFAKAKICWLAHAEMSVHKSHAYLGGCMTTLQDTIEELENIEENKDE